MQKINSISRYNCAYELLEEFCGADFWDEIDSEDDIFLRHFDDFEGYAYFCLDGCDIIVTDFYGDVINQYADIDGFLLVIEDLLAADREDR